MLELVQNVLNGIEANIAVLRSRINAIELGQSRQIDLIKNLKEKL